MNERFLSLPEEKQLAIINASLEVFAKYPYLMEFSVKAYYSKMEEVSEAVQSIMKQQSATVLNYFQNVDFSNLKEPESVWIWRILWWFFVNGSPCLSNFLIRRNFYDNKQ